VRDIHQGTELLAKESGELSVSANEISLAARNQPGPVPHCAPSRS